MRHAILLAVALNLAAPAIAAPADLAIDPERTLPRFTIDRFGFGSLHGFFVRSTGNVVVDAATRTAAIDLQVRTTSMRLGKAGAPETVQDRADGTPDDVPSFLEAEAHPVMTLKAKSVRIDAARATPAVAELTFRGVTRPVALTVIDWRCDPPGPDGCFAVATAQVRRSEFGVTVGYPFVGDDVTLRFELATRRR